ncbi:hypothetical protein [Streptomyces pactum]|uniref:hypothetical protein n=1 Tax=Streptomyces pactum TaxID=68249 RepID=UPI0006E28A94
MTWRCVESVASGDENAQLVSAESLVPAEVVDAAPTSAVRRATGATSSVVPQEPELDLQGDESLLEAATPETYVAVSRYDLPAARA